MTTIRTMIDAISDQTYTLREIPTFTKMSVLADNTTDLHTLFTAYDDLIGILDNGDVVLNTCAGIDANSATMAPIVEQIRILSSNGNVGINDTTPSQKLDVGGNARVAGNIVATGNVSGVDMTASGNISVVDVNASGDIDATGKIKENGNDLIPPGAMMEYAGAAAPAGWLLCDNSAVSRTVTYDELFAVIGTTYGVGDGVTTFNVPDMRGRIPVGVGTGDAADATEFVRGDKDGAETHDLIEAQIPSHTHHINAQNTDLFNTDHTHTWSDTSTGVSQGHYHAYQALLASGSYGRSEFSSNGVIAAQMTGVNDRDHTHDVAGTTSPASGAPNHQHAIAAKNTLATGGGTAHNNLQPSLCFNFIIKY